MNPPQPQPQNSLLRASALRSRIEVLTKESLLRPKTAPVALWRTSLCLIRGKTRDVRAWGSNRDPDS